MRQRHKGLARDAVSASTPRRQGSVKGLRDKITTATPPRVDDVKVNFLAALTMRALTGLGFIPNQGTRTVRARTATTYVRPDAAVIARRRARNKRARQARRVHRQAARR